MVNQIFVLGALLIGIGVAAIVTLFEVSNRSANRPYSHGRGPSHRPPSPPPSPPPRPIIRRRPTNTEQRHRATSTSSPEVADRATSPINSARHFSERCRNCEYNDREVVAFQPCGDYVMCRPCAEEFLKACKGQRNCPDCNRRIESIG